MPFGDCRPCFSIIPLRPIPNTKVLCAYIIFLLLFFAYSFYNSFVPPLAFVSSILLFQVPPVSSWLTASSLVLPFSAVSYSVDEPQRMTWQRIGEKKAKQIPA